MNAAIALTPLAYLAGRIRRDSGGGRFVMPQGITGLSGVTAPDNRTHGEHLNMDVAFLWPVAWGLICVFC